MGRGPPDGGGVPDTVREQCGVRHAEGPHGGAGEGRHPRHRMPAAHGFTVLMHGSNRNFCQRNIFGDLGWKFEMMTIPPSLFRTSGPIRQMGISSPNIFTRKKIPHPFFILLTPRLFPIHTHTNPYPVDFWKKNHYYNNHSIAIPFLDDIARFN